MADRPSPPVATRRRWVLAAAAIGWIAIVVAGAGADANDSLLGVEDLDTVWTVVFGLAMVLCIAFFIYLKPFAGEWVQPEKSRHGIGVWLFLGGIMLLWVWRPDFLSELVDEEALGVLDVALDPQIDETPEPASETVAQVSDLLLIAVAIAVLGGAWYGLRRRSKQAEELDDDAANSALETDLAEALDQASIELSSTTDPRTAVLRSYAILETVLATHGWARSMAETPTEHLRRSLRNLRVDSAPLVELGRLYELARFSDHPISAQQQVQAAQALGRARTSLATHP